MKLNDMWHEVDRHLGELDFGSLWQGFHRFDLALYNETEVCLNGEMIPKTEEFLANTAIKYRGRDTAIFSVSPDEDTVILASKAVHEMFHAFQNEHGESRYPNEIEALMKYCYDEVNLSMKYRENTILATLSEKYDDALFGRFLSSRKARQQRFPFEYAYETKTEQIEGTANYVELMTLKKLDKSRYLSALEEIKASLSDRNSLFPVRIGLYASGAMLIKILTGNGIAFDTGFSDSVFSDSLLTYIKAADCPESDGETAKALDAYREGIKKKIDRLTCTEPVARGEFELLGVNVYDAAKYGDYIYTTYFLAYADTQQHILYGNYLIRMDGGKIAAVYKDCLTEVDKT